MPATIGANSTRKLPIIFGLPVIEYTRVRTLSSVCDTHAAGIGAATINW